MHAIQQQYKHDYDKLVGTNTKFAPGDMVYVGRPPLYATATSSSQAMSNTTYDKLLARATGSFRVLAVRSHTVTADIGGIHRTISIKRATCAPDATYVMQKEQTPQVSPANVNQNAKPMAPGQSTRLVLQTADPYLTTPRGKKWVKPIAS